MRGTGSLYFAQFMLQWFIWLPEFSGFNENFSHLGKTPLMDFAQSHKILGESICEEIYQYHSHPAILFKNINFVWISLLQNALAKCF